MNKILPNQGHEKETESFCLEQTYGLTVDDVDTLEYKGFMFLEVLRCAKPTIVCKYLPNCKV